MSRNRRSRPRAVPLVPEVRFLRAQPLEVRSGADNQPVLRGRPIVYDTPYQVQDMFGSFTERMAPTVCDDVLQRGADVRFLFNHDGLPLARSASGTLSLLNGPGGLDVEVRLDGRQGVSQDLLIAVERGDVSEMSCGFIVARDEWDDAMESRTIHSFAQLLDVSAVTYPASPTTHIQVAERMIAEVPVESRARLRQALVRAGKVLSGSNEDQLAQACRLLHGVLASGGFDPATLLDDGGESSQTEDGSQADSTGTGDQSVDGSSGMRVADLEAELTRRTQRMIEQVAA